MYRGLKTYGATPEERFLSRLWLKKPNLEALMGRIKDLEYHTAHQGYIGYVVRRVRNVVHTAKLTNRWSRLARCTRLGGRLDHLTAAPYREKPPINALSVWRVCADPHLVMLAIRGTPPDKPGRAARLTMYKRTQNKFLEPLLELWQAQTFSPDEVVDAALLHKLCIDVEEIPRVEVSLQHLAAARQLVQDKPIKALVVGTDQEEAVTPPTIAEFCTIMAKMERHIRGIWTIEDHTRLSLLADILQDVLASRSITQRVA